MRKLLHATMAIQVVGLSGCQSSDKRYRPTGDAPLEREQTTHE